MKKALTFVLLLAACAGTARNEVDSAEQPVVLDACDGTVCPAGDDCFAPEVCATERVVCPPGEDCFAPEVCGDEERVFEKQE